MKIQHLAMGLLALALSVGVSYASDLITKGKEQENVVVITPEQSAQLLIERMANDVVLSEQQKTVLQQKATEWLQRRREINTTLKAWSEEHMSALQAADSAYEEALKSVLTFEQQEGLIEKQEMRREEMKQQVVQSFREEEKKVQ
jgi:hypothetical protein